MGWDGAGGYDRVHNFSADASANVKVLAARIDAEFDEMASAFTNVVTRDGQGTFTGNPNLGGNRYVNVAAAASVSDYMRAREVIENVPIFMEDAATSTDRVSVAPSYFTSVSANQAPADGVRVIIRVGSNKSSAALFLNDHSANIQFQDGTRINHAMVSGGIYEFIYSSSDSAWKIQNPDDGRTADEISASITPTNLKWPQGDPRRYGAKGDGTTDDTTAVQNTFTVGGEITIPAGLTFLVKSRITGVSNTYVSGRGTVKGDFDDYILHWKNVSDVHLTDFRVIGDAANGKTTQHGVSLEGVTDFTVRGIRGHQCSGRGIRIAYDHDNNVAPENGVVANNVITDCGDVGIFLKSVLQVDVVGNVIDRLGNYGDTTFSIGVVVDDGSGAQTGIPSERVVVANNIIRDLSGNEDCRGINVTGVNDVAICNNLLEDIGKTGGTSSVGMPGIRLDNGGLTPDNPVNRAIVTGNILNGVAGDGMVINEVTDGLVANNLIIDYGANTTSANAAGIDLVENNNELVVTQNYMVAGTGADIGVRVGSTNGNCPVYNNIVNANGISITTANLIQDASDVAIPFQNFRGNVNVEGGLQDTATGTYTLVAEHPVTVIDSSGGAVTGTLGDGPYIGFQKTIVMTDATNSSTVSVTNHETSDPEVFTFADVDDTLVLMWTGTEWITVANSGVTV